MKTPKTAFAVGYIDDDLIISAEKCGNAKKNSSKLLKWTSIAACFVLIIGACTLMLPLDRGGDISEPEMIENGSGTEVDISGNTNVSADRYKEYVYSSTEEGRVWPWEMLSDAERYSSVSYNDTKYGGSGRTISSIHLEGMIGTGEASGSDPFTGKAYCTAAEIYKIAELSSERYVAAKIGETFYVFTKTALIPTGKTTLGEFFEQHSLEKTLRLNRFLSQGKSYTLKNDEFIYDTLREYSSTPIVYTDDPFDFSSPSKKSITFRISSDQLGIYKLSLTITIEGYLKTNLTGYGYSFFIGEGAAKKIIDYAETNATPTESEPYEYRAIGKIVELTDEYVIIDDSFLCKDESEGVIYKVLLNDIRINRWFTDKMNYVGRVVLIVHENKAVVENGVVIDSAIDVEFPYITIDGNIYIPE